MADNNITKDNIDFVDITADDDDIEKPGRLPPAHRIKKPSIRVKNLAPPEPPTGEDPDDDKSPIEKRCENPDCSAPTLISLVPIRPTPQFVQEPKIIADPILVNGYTTVFQVDGAAAKMSELAEKTSDGKIRYESQRPIYRIVPNTHAHIVNYVIIDAEGDTLRKIRENDPQTVKKLLESQKNSADQLLERLMGTKKSSNELVSPSTVQRSAAPTTRPAVSPGTIAAASATSGSTEDSSSK